MTMNAILNTKEIARNSSTVVAEEKTITGPTVTALKPQIQGVETQTIWPTKHPVNNEDVKMPAIPEDIEAEIDTPDEKQQKLADSPLSEQDLADRKNLTGLVREGFDGARLAENALRQIRDRRLWRNTHKSFADFCTEEFDLSEQRVSQILQYADELAYLSGKVSEDIIPATERAIRELRRVKKDNKVEVLIRASELLNGGRPNSAAIEKARVAIEGVSSSKSKVESINAEAALKAAKVVVAFIKGCDLNDLKIGEIKELRDIITSIGTDSVKLVSA